MNTPFKYFSILFFLFPIGLIGQVDVQPNAVSINAMNPISELAVNSPGQVESTVYIESKTDIQGGRALYAKAFEVTGFGETTYAIIGDANVGTNPIFSWGILGSSVRTSASNNGRSAGIRGTAGNATPGANYAVFGDLQGTNNGTAILGYDRILHGNWSQVLPSVTSYAGYFHGKGFFLDNVGLGQNDPQEKLHVTGGNIYVEGASNGIILTDNNGGCHLVTVDAATGDLTASSITCP